MPRINPRNFAVNERCYNVARKKPFYDPEMYNNNNYTWTSTSVNADTAMGLSSFHENRFRGTAAFVWTF